MQEMAWCRFKKDWGAIVARRGHCPEGNSSTPGKCDPSCVFRGSSIPGIADEARLRAALGEQGEMDFTPSTGSPLSSPKGSGRTEKIGPQLWCSLEGKWAAVMAAEGIPCPENMLVCDAMCVFSSREEVPADEVGEVLAARAAVRRRIEERGKRNA